MRVIYKEPKTLDEQVQYLHDNKNVDFVLIDEVTAKKILYESNYINVITPFKHRFARTDKTGAVIRDSNHRHQYDKITDFSEYNQAYHVERDKYPTIFANIQEFESKMNAIVSYEIIHFYGIVSYSKFLDFVDDLKKNLENLSNNGDYNPEACEKMSIALDSFLEMMSKYDDIYIFMDRLGLSDLITVFRCCDKSLRTKIYKSLKEHGGVLGYETFESFDEFLSRIPGIRNYVCHFNSLEVLVMYLHIRNKELRPSSDRKKYQKIIKKLSIPKNNEGSRP